MSQYLLKILLSLAMSFGAVGAGAYAFGPSGNGGYDYQSDYGKPTAVPELSAQAAGSSLVLLVGATAIAASRRRRASV